MDIFGSHYFVMFNGVVFRKIISQIVLSLIPKNVELFLVVPITEQVIAHVFGNFLFSIFCDKIVCGGIVSFYWCGRLGVF